MLTIKKETNLVFSIYNRNECVAFRRYGLMSTNNNSDNYKINDVSQEQVVNCKKINSCEQGLKATIICQHFTGGGP